MTTKSKIIIVALTSVISSLSYFIPIANIIIWVLSFLILLEAVRVTYEYIVYQENRIKLRYLIDGAIVFGVRELFVGWAMLKTDTILGAVIMGISLVAVGILFVLRLYSVKLSPSVTEHDNINK